MLCLPPTPPLTRCNPPPSTAHFLLRRAFDFVFGRDRDQRSCRCCCDEREGGEGRGDSAAAGVCCCCCCCCCCCFCCCWCHLPCLWHPCNSSPLPFQSTFGTIPSTGSRIKMPSPVSSLLSLSGTDSNATAASSRVAAAKRIGGGFDKGECVVCVSLVQACVFVDAATQRAMPSPRAAAADLLSQGRSFQL